MGAKQSENSNLNYYSIKAKTDDKDPTPFIGKSTKIDGVWGISEKFDEFDGYLVDIAHDSYEYEGEKKHKVKMTFVDDDGTKNIVESNFNNMLYSFLNSLAGTEAPELIQFNVYLGKAKVNEDGTAGKQWASIWVKNNGEDTEWKVPPADLPKPKYVTVPGIEKQVMVDTDVVEYWRKVIVEIKATLKPAETYVKATVASAEPAMQANATEATADNAIPATEATKAAPDTDVNPNPVEEAPADDLPF